MTSNQQQFCLTVDCFSIVFSFLPEKDIVAMQNLNQLYYRRILTRLFLKMPNPSYDMPTAVSYHPSNGMFMLEPFSRESRKIFCKNSFLNSVNFDAIDLQSITFLSSSLAYFSYIDDILEDTQVQVGRIKVRRSWLFDSRGGYCDPEDESTKPSITQNTIGSEVRESLSSRLEFSFEYMLELISIGRSSQNLFMLAVRKSQEQMGGIPFFQYNVEEGFLEELEDCPCASLRGKILTTTCRVGYRDEEDCFLYVTDEAGQHNNSGMYKFYRINIGQFAYNEWEVRTLRLPYHLRISCLNHLMAHHSDKDQIMILYDCDRGIKYLSVNFGHAFQTNYAAVYHPHLGQDLKKGKHKSVKSFGWKFEFNGKNDAGKDV